MDCRTAESMVQRYINQTLSLEEMQEFIAHVRQCPSCYDELETYFTVSTAVQHLSGGMDDEFGTSMDMHKLLEMDLKKKEISIRHRKIRRNLLFVFLCLAVFLAAGLTVWLFFI